MSSFRRPQTIRRYTDGSYVKGKWVAGQDCTELQILASVQPMTNSDMQHLPEGKRIKRGVKIYTSELLKVDGTDNQGDELLWLGIAYRVIAVAMYQMGVISHYRYYAVTGVES